MINIKRPLLVIAIGIIIGIIYGLYLRISMAIFIAIIILLILSIIMQNKKGFNFIVKRRKLIIIIITCALFSNCYTYFANKKYEEFYDNANETINLEGIVISDLQETEYYNKYIIKSDNKKFIIYVNKNYPQILKYGMWIKLEGDFREPAEKRNYKGFNYKEYLKTQKIYGSIKTNNIEILDESKINIISKYSNKIRNKIIEIANQILNKETSGLLIGILIGDRVGINEEITNNFSESSLTHILAISGSHITYIILGLSYILIKSKIPKRLSYYIINFILVIFMFVTGFSSSVVRASIMGILLISSKIFYRKADILSSISLTLIILLIYNPFLIKDIGLQLSYLGTIGIVLFNKLIFNILNKKLPCKIAEIISITLSAQILIIPIIALNFNTISLTFLLSNALAVPLSGIITIYGYVNVFIGLISINMAQTCAIVLKFLLEILMLIAQIVANIPHSNILITTPNLIYIILYYLIIFLFKKIKIRKILIVILLVIILFNTIYNLIPKNLKIHIIDVGQRRWGAYNNT